MEEDTLYKVNCRHSSAQGEYATKQVTHCTGFGRCWHGMLDLLNWQIFWQTDRHPFNGLFFYDNLHNPAPERLSQSRF